MRVAPHWYSPSRYMAACHGHAPGLELVPPTILRRAGRRSYRQTVGTGGTEVERGIPKERARASVPPIIARVEPLYEP